MKRVGVYLVALCMTGAVAAGQAARGKIVYHDRVYPDAASACIALLKDEAPTERLKAAGPVDEYGNVHCAGQDSKGDTGYDMYQNAVHVESGPAPEEKPAAAAEFAGKKAAQVPPKPPGGGPPRQGEPPKRSGTRVLLVGPETDAEFAYAEQVNRSGGTAVAVNPVKSAAAERFVAHGGQFVQGTLESLPTDPPFDIIREDYPYPTGGMFARAVDMVRVRLARLRVGGAWSLITEKADFVSALQAAIHAEGATVVTHPLPPAHEGVPTSNHLRDPARFSLLVTRTR